MTLCSFLLLYYALLWSSASLHWWEVLTNSNCTCTSPVGQCAQGKSNSPGFWFFIWSALKGWGIHLNLIFFLQSCFQSCLNLGSDGWTFIVPRCPAGPVHFQKHNVLCLRQEKQNQSLRVFIQTVTLPSRNLIWSASCMQDTTNLHLKEHTIPSGIHIPLVTRVKRQRFNHVCAYPVPKPCMNYHGRPCVLAQGPLVPHSRYWSFHHLLVTREKQRLRLLYPKTKGSSWSLWATTSVNSMQKICFNTAETTQAAFVGAGKKYDRNALLF